MEVTQFTMEEIIDPTGIIEGKRYEFLLDIHVDEEDELYSEAGTQIRLLLGDNGEGLFIMNYFIQDKKDGKYIELALEEEEEQFLLDFCREQLN
ncbi:MAG: pullulanase [Lysinibacillus sp.]|nr:pullulanase [Lysinibacillus sp.]